MWEKLVPHSLLTSTLHTTMSKIVNLITKLGYVFNDRVLDDNTVQLVSIRLNEGHLVTLDGAKPLTFQPALRWNASMNAFVVLVKDDENNELGALRGQCITQVIEGVYTLECVGQRKITVVAHDVAGREELLQYADA